MFSLLIQATFRIFFFFYKFKITVSKFKKKTNQISMFRILLILKKYNAPTFSFFKFLFSFVQVLECAHCILLCHVLQILSLFYAS